MADPLLVTFVTEAQQQLALAERLLAGMDRGLGMAGGAEINGCYRAIHTLSGLAGHLGLARIQVLIQGVEHLLEEMRLNRLQRGAARIDTVRKAIARIAELVDCLASGAEPAADDAAIIVEIRSWTCAPACVRRPPVFRRDDRSVHRYQRSGTQIPTGPPSRTAIAQAAIHDR
jgi:chemotaxis protein histidine kinase CheA